MNEYTIFGNHTANIDGILPLIENVDDTDWNKMYEKLRPNPIPRFNPIPPLTFLDDSETPIAVRMNAANDAAIRL